MARPKKTEDVADEVKNEIVEPIEEIKKEETIDKTEFDKVVEEKNNLAQMLAQLQSQMIQMQAQMNSTPTTKEKNLSKKVKVINLLFRTLNLSTEPMGRGRLFTFKNFGDMVTMRTSDLEEILSISTYRKQAENMWYYICDADIVEDQDLSDVYENGITKEAIEHIMTLVDDNCVEMFVSLSKKLQESIALKMAEDMAEGRYFDRNRLADIQRRTELDVESMSREVKEIKDRIKK